ncbi:hypothetical protein C5167_013061 [Papaver somniferum]|uniref:Uncharacterized protein n=1 Tax=Papaver somniferum TaxID=3469 RepID=A0A4Y7J370_PAPSO|nr:hypothetical protein C5167_013061 [Papaver somniferum]
MWPSELWNPDTEGFLRPITNVGLRYWTKSEKDKKIEELFNELQHEKRSAGFRERHYLVLNDMRQAKQLAELHSQ